MLMYARALVPRPWDQTGTLANLATIWSSVGSAAQSAADEAQAAADHIRDNNEGTAAEAFLGASTGDTSSAGGLARLAEAAARTSAAFTAAASASGEGLAAMDSLCWRAELEYLKARLDPSPVALYNALKIVAETRRKLKALESATVNAIETVFAGIDLPVPLVNTYDQGQSAGTIPPELEEAWRNLTDEEKRDVLQKIADEQAIANGMEPKPIDWNSNANGHWDPNTSTLHINAGKLDDPHTLHVAVHESQHGLQFKMIEDYSNLSQSDRDAIADGTMQDPFVQYGSNIDEVARFDKNWNETGYQVYDGRGDASSDSWRYYYYQPFEHDARRAGTEFLDDLTPEKLQEYVG
jgi:predicted kinase